MTVYTVYTQLNERRPKMNLCIDNRSGQPIYEQIFMQIKGQIISGDLSENAPLPSIRNLAKELRISVITTKRAYDEYLLTYHLIETFSEISSLPIYLHQFCVGSSHNCHLTSC